MIVPYNTASYLEALRYRYTFTGAWEVLSPIFKFSITPLDPEEQSLQMRLTTRRGKREELNPDNTDDVTSLLLPMRGIGESQTTRIESKHHPRPSIGMDLRVQLHA
jgi:hypothetical protein